MSRAYYKTRVVYNPLTNEYTVESKRRWFSKWRHEQSYCDHEFCVEGAARKKAIDVADRLMQDVVVHEGVK